jgi:hypothetical protein
MTGMLQMESGRLNKFTGTKVSKIKIKSLWKEAQQEV